MPTNQLAALIRKLPPDVKNIVFADANHDDRSIREALTNDEVIQALKDRGIGTFIPEGPTAANKLVAAYKKDKNAFDVLRFPYASETEASNRAYNDTAHKFLKKVSDNFNTRFVDKHVDQITTPELIQVTTVATSVLSDKKCGQVIVNEYKKQLPEKTRTSIESFFLARLSPEVNQQIATDAIDQAKAHPKNQGVALLYGIGHVVNMHGKDKAARDLNEYMAQNGKTVTIALLPSNTKQSIPIALNPDNNDIPEYSYFIKENQVVENSSPAAKQAFIKLFEPTKNNASFNECKNRIPDHVKNDPTIRKMLNLPSLEVTPLTLPSDTFQTLRGSPTPDAKQSGQLK